MDLLSFSGKTTIVTGAGPGKGEVITKGFAGKGADRIDHSQWLLQGMRGENI